VAAGAPPSPVIASPAPSAAPAARRSVPSGAGGAEAARKSASAGGADLTDGVALVGKHDYGAGAAKLSAFADAHPGDARAEDAAFLAAVALKLCGRQPDAAAAAQRYLARYPSGRRRAEAEAIAAGH
jgi:TolA-binding protein